MQEGDKLKKIKENLKLENEDLIGEKEMNDMVIKEKVAQTKSQKQRIKEVGTVFCKS